MVLQSALAKITNICQRIIQPGDHPDLVFQKMMLMYVTLGLIPAGIVWGGLYIFFDELIAGLIPISYSIVSLVNIVICVHTRKFYFFRFVQLGYLLIAPFLLMTALGGFSSGSAVIIWSVMAPFGAMLFYKKPSAPRWLVGYLSLVCLSGVLQPFLLSANNLPEAFINILFVLNIGVVSFATFALLFYFITGKNTALELLRQEQD